MSGKRELVLVAWSGNRSFMGTPSLRDKIAGTKHNVLNKQNIGLVWSWLFSLPYALPTHPSFPLLSVLVDAELRDYLAGDQPSPVVCVYERWQIPIEIWNGAWKAVDTGMLGWGSFQQRDIPSYLRYPWTVTATASEFAALFGKYANDLSAKPSDEVRIGADGFIHCASPADPSEGTELPQVYGRLAANEYIAELRDSSRTSTPPFEGDTPFTQTLVNGMRAIGGKPATTGAYDWCLDTPIGALLYSVSRRAILCRWDDVAEAASQIGAKDMNPHSGKWNHYVDEAPTKEEAEKIVNDIGRVVSNLRSPTEKRVWEGGVRA